jgi:hypothetical protein
VTSCVLPRILAGALLLLLPTDFAAAGNFDFWILSGLERVKVSDGGGLRRAAELHAARGEFEAFQIVVRPKSRPLRNLRLTSTDLVQAGQKTIQKHNITLYQERFVDVGEASPDWGGSNRSIGAGRYPDVLTYLNPLPGGKVLRADNSSGALAAVMPGELQPFWVDVFVPRDAKPGNYKGRIDISSDEKTVSIPISLVVWNFELPLNPSLVSSFGYGASGKLGMEELLRHKLMPLRTTLQQCKNGCSSSAAYETQLMRSFGLTATDTGFWSGADRHTCKMTDAPSQQAFAKAAKSHAKGLLLYNYTADEIDACPAIFESLKQWSRNMKASGIKNLVVMSPSADLVNSASGQSVVDIWVVLPKMFDVSKNFVTKAILRGAQVWSYNTLSQDGYSPKWLIDYDLINYRIQPGFINQSLGLTGLLYWKVDNWSSSRWDEVNNTGKFGAANYPGEGILIYSGTALGIDGVLPSIRLKVLRDGVEDYEYVEILKRLGRGDVALSIAKAVGRDWSHWSRSAEAIQKARQRLGEEINAAMNQRSATTSKEQGRSPR